MEKLCIVKRRTRIGFEDDSTASIVSQENENVIQERDVHALSQTPRKNSSGINVHDADTLIFKEVAGEEEQIFSIELTPQQTKVVQSMNCIKDLLSGKHHGVKMSIAETQDGKTAFNFHFKPVYTTRMLNAQDVAVMLQISKSMLYKLVKDKELKSYKVGKLRRFLLEDVIGYLSRSIGSEVGL